MNRDYRDYRDVLGWEGVRAHGLFCGCEACRLFTEKCLAAGVMTPEEEAVRPNSASLPHASSRTRSRGAGNVRADLQL